MRFHFCIEFRADKQVSMCALHKLQQMVIRRLNVGQDDLAKEDLDASFDVLALRDEVTVGGVPMRAHGIEVEVDCFDVAPVMDGRRDGDGMAAAV